MRSRWLVAVCWSVVVCGTIIAALFFTQLFAGPTLQFNYDRGTHAVTTLIAGGAAERAGLRPGDVIQTINGARAGRGATPLYFSRPGDAVPVVFARNGTVRTVRVVAETNGATLARQVRAGGGDAIAAINIYMVMPLNAWVMLLGVFLLVMRPDDRAARVSAMSLISWASGYFLSGTAPGIGALLAPLPLAARQAIFLLDSAFAAIFFAFCIDFALTFASEHDHPPRTWMRVVAYLAMLPILIENARISLDRMNPAPAAHGPAPEPVYEILGPILLLVALAILATRFFRITDRNARRRVAMIFVSLLPGAAGFAIQVIVSRVTDAFTPQQVTRLLAQTGTMAGSSIYAYAVLRHRMYGIRVLVRRSIRYALARGTLFVAMSLPVIGLVAFLYEHRNDSLASLITGTPAAYLLIIVPLLLVIRYRKRLFDALDRRYFREQYDARQLLLHVVSMVRDGSDMIGLSRVSLDEIERALHPKHISLWRGDAEGKEFVCEVERGADFSPTERVENLPTLAMNGALPALLAGDPEPLDVFGRANRPMRNRLSLHERQWLEATRAYLLVPLLIEARLVGIMLLGERMSEEPYSHEDRDLLRAIGAQLAFTFHYSRLKESPSLVWTPSARTPVSLGDDVRLCARCGRCFSSEHEVCEVDHETLSREDGVPRIIEEKYILTRMLGRGGMGSVYLATQRRLNRPVAVKVLLSHLVGSSTMRARFEREARIVARLKHPSIVMIHDFGVLASNHAYLVMEYLDGETLRRTVQRGAIGVGEMLEILTPIADAVETAHRAGVVHRDLKPENVMIVADGERRAPRVLDFGLAKMTGPIAEDEATLVQSRESIGVVGTLMYLAPEVLSGNAADAKSDQYSLGLMAYEMLLGRHPFSAATDLASIVHAQTKVVPQPLHEVIPSVPESVSRAVARAMEKDCDARFESVADFVRELQSGTATQLHS